MRRVEEGIFKKICMSVTVYFGMPVYVTVGSACARGRESKRRERGEGERRKVERRRDRAISRQRGRKTVRGKGWAEQGGEKEGGGAAKEGRGGGRGSEGARAKMCNISSITSANRTPEKTKVCRCTLKFFKSKPGSVSFFLSEMSAPRIVAKFWTGFTYLCKKALVSHFLSFFHVM